MHNSRRFYYSVLAIAISFAIIIFPISAFAMNEDYVDDVAKFYNNSNKVNISNDYVDGVCEYIFDYNDCCAYFHFLFTDLNKNNITNKSVIFNFSIYNDTNSYTFSVNNSGFVKADDYIEKAFDVYCNYINIDNGYGLVETAIGIQFKKSDDKKLNNNINIDYFYGKTQRSNLIKNLEFDMFVPTTTKITTTKVTTTKTTTIKETTTKSTTTKKTTSNTTSSKSTSSNSSETSQKFVPSSIKSSSTTTTKKTTTQSSNSNTSTTQFEPDTSLSSEIVTQQESNSSQTVSQNQEVTTQDTNLNGDIDIKIAKNRIPGFIAVGVLMLIGIILLIIAMVKKDKQN